jgi:hypothetical protein
MNLFLRELKKDNKVLPDIRKEKVHIRKKIKRDPTPLRC